MEFKDTNCGECSSIGTITKRVFNNSLKYYCCICGKSYSLPLLKIRKKIIYLDQNFFSHVYKKNASEFLTRFNRLSKLAKKQLIICPYSEAHDKETHLANDSKKLWEFIRNISRGKHFYLKSKIETQQLLNAYISFLRNEPKNSKIILSDAIEPSVHDWDESARCEVIWNITDFIKPSLLRQSKENFVKLFIKVLPQWRKSQSSMYDDFKLEIRDHIKFLYGNFWNILISGGLEKMLESDEHRKVHMLLYLDISGKELEEKFTNVKAFFMSDHFANIPYVNISAGLWTILKDKIKKKQFLSERTKNEKVSKKVRGIPFDIEHLSVFAPYCDAVFTEKTMAGCLEEWKHHPLGGYTFKVFSAANWDDFDNYLSDIENTTSEMEEELKIVYGSND